MRLIDVRRNKSRLDCNQFGRMEKKVLNLAEWRKKVLNLAVLAQLANLFRVPRR